MKKGIIYIVSAVILLVLVGGLIIFALSGDNTTESESVSMKGTWKVVTYVNNGAATLMEEEFMVFSDEQAQVYREGNKEPYATSKYTIDSSMLMDLSDISRKYTVDGRTENHVRLYESASVYMYLLRYPNEDMSDVEIDTSLVSGRWDIVYRDTDTDYSDEYLVFEDGVMYDYHGNSQEPTAKLDYVWDGNQIILSAINKKMVLNLISDTEIAFIETDTGFIWELKKGE